MQVAGNQLRNPPCEVPARALTAYLAIDQHPACPNGGRLEPLTPEMIPFGTKSVTLSMLIDLLTSTCRSTQVKSASTDL